MEITEIRIKLMEDAQERLQAFCSITFDFCFVIRDLKIIEGSKGSFVAMPSRKLTDRCPACQCKNHLRAQYCNQCGTCLPADRSPKPGTLPKAADGRVKLYADIAHPINARCREQIQTRVLEAFQAEQLRAQQPGYVSTYDDLGESDDGDLSLFLVNEPTSGEALRLDAGVSSDKRSPINPPHLDYRTGSMGDEPARNPRLVPTSPVDRHFRAPAEWSYAEHDSGSARMPFSEPVEFGDGIL